MSSSRIFKIDTFQLQSSLNREGREAAAKLLSSPAALNAVNAAWADPSVKKLDWKEMRALAEPGSSTSTESKEEKAERQGHHSIIFLEDQDHQNRRPYLIGETIARGGKAVLKNAYDLSTGDHVALRVVRGVTDDLAEQEFRNERHGLQFFFFYCGEQRRGAKAYLAQDYIVGKDLDYYNKALQDMVLNLKTTPGNSIRILNTLIHIFGSTLSDMTSLHKNDFVHRDIKPANIMCLSNINEGNNGSLIDKTMVIDFGSMDKDLGRPKSPELGTTTYLAPEIVLVDDPQLGKSYCYTQASDNYALGKSLDLVSAYLSAPLLRLFFRKQANEIYQEMNACMSRIVTGLTNPSPSARWDSQQGFNVFQEGIVTIYAKSQVVHLIAEGTLSTDMQKLGLKTLDEVQGEPSQDSSPSFKK